MSKKIMWNDSYVQFSFNCTETTKGLQKPQCMFYNIVFSKASLKPSKLQKHLNNLHGGADVLGRGVESLKAKRIRFESRGTLQKLDFLFADKLLLMASYHVAYNVTKSKEPHTITKEVIKPCVLQMKKSCSGKRNFKKLN